MLNLSPEASPLSYEPSSCQRGCATGQQIKFSPTTSLHLTPRLTVVSDIIIPQLLWSIDF